VRQQDAYRQTRKCSQNYVQHPRPFSTATFPSLIACLILAYCRLLTLTAASNACWCFTKYGTVASVDTLIITNRSFTFRYASTRLWNLLPDSLRHPHQSCLDSPPRPLVNPSLSSSPLSSVIHHSFTLSLQAQNLPLNKSFPR